MIALGRTVPDVQPLIIPSNLEATSYEGFLHLPSAGSLATALWLRLSDIPHGQGTLSGAQLECSIELSDLIEGHEDIIEARLADSPDVVTFFVELTSLLERLLRHRPPLEVPAYAFYSGLVDEMEAVGWQSISWTSPSLSALTLSIQDAAGRRHDIKVQLPASYPQAAPLVQADLPEESPVLQRQPGKSSLAALLHHYEAAIEGYQELWGCLEDLDREAWVLEPDKATLAHTFRRIALGRHCSLLLTLSASHPRGLPLELCVLGPDSAARVYQDLLHAGSREWEAARMPRENLEVLLQMKLPSRTLATEDDISADCCICYAYRLPTGNPSALGTDNAGGHQPLREAQDHGECTAGEVPDEACPNARCGRPFHRRCLLEWLLAVSTSRRSFNTIFGECPYCSQPITARMV